MSEEEKRGPGRPPKAATVKARVLRDYWTRGDGSDDDRVRAGTELDVTMEDLIDGLERGFLERVK